MNNWEGSNYATWRYSDDRFSSKKGNTSSFGKKSQDDEAAKKAAAQKESARKLEQKAAADKAAADNAAKAAKVAADRAAAKAAADKKVKWYKDDTRIKKIVNTDARVEKQKALYEKYITSKPTGGAANSDLPALPAKKSNTIWWIAGGVVGIGILISIVYMIKK